MVLNIFSLGEEGEKTFNGQTVIARPFSGDDGTSMGVGLEMNNNASFWGLMMPRKVINSYRGMKIAELVKDFGHGTLAACWYAGNRKVHSSDQRYVDEIEAKIGSDARERILGMVPEDLDTIIEGLQARGFDFAAWEIEEEVDSGVLRATPGIQSALDKYHREQELFKEENYGRVIDPREARKGISDLGKIGKRFLEVYDHHVVPNIGIKFSNFGISKYFLVGKARADENIECTLSGGSSLGLFGFGCNLQLGLEYGGNDVAFQPRVPTPPSGLLHRWGIKKIKEPGISDNFPLIDRKYGATISPEGSINNPSYNIKINSRNVESLAVEMYDALQATRAAV